MTTTAIRQKLHKFIDTADEQNIETVYNFIQAGLVAANPGNKWDDNEFVAEMKQRVNALKDGIGKGHSWEEVKKMAKSAANHKKK